MNKTYTTRNASRLAIVFSVLFFISFLLLSGQIGINDNLFKAIGSSSIFPGVILLVYLLFKARFEIISDNEFLYITFLNGTRNISPKEITKLHIGIEPFNTGQGKVIRAMTMSSGDIFISEMLWSGEAVEEIGAYLKKNVNENLPGIFRQFSG